jgi:hypothetical protein
MGRESLMRMKIGRVLGYVLPLTVVACSEGGPTGPPEGHVGGVATVAFNVLGANLVHTVAVEVSGPGIDSLLVFDIAVDSLGAGSATVRVPAGAGRHISASAYDTAGVNTHRGDTTVTLLAGTNPAVSLTLLPLMGGLPITLSFGNAGLTLTPGDTTISLGTTLQYSAGGLDSLGNAIVASAVTWSSSDLTIAVVTATGLAQARAVGSAYVLATYQGATIGRKMTVTP